MPGAGSEGTRPARGVFITGTDTGVGKTVLSAALLAAIAATGERVRAHKPVVTGLDAPSGAWPPDHELLGSVAGMPAEAVAAVGYGPAVSPHLAARLAGDALDFSDLRARAAAVLTEAGEDGATLVIEGVGGLLTPLTDGHDVRDLIVAAELPVVIAARATLGTINHSLLTIEAARAAAIEVRAVVLTPWPREPSVLELSNRETIGRLGGVEVATLPAVASPDAGALAAAGAVLPWCRWIDRAGAYAGSRARRGATRPGGVGGDPARTAASTAALTAATS